MRAVREREGRCVVARLHVWWRDSSARECGILSGCVCAKIREELCVAASTLSLMRVMWSKVVACACGDTCEGATDIVERSRFERAAP